MATRIPMTCGLILAATGTGWAQTSGATSTTNEAGASPPGTIQQIRQPVPWLRWGSDLRIRYEYFNNILTLSPDVPLHEQSYFRFRARLWTTVTPVTNLNLNARLATEPREWLNPAGYTPYKGRTGLDMTEGVFDILNLQWTNNLPHPITVTIGRQEIMLGDGWLVMEGTPLDGSWTYWLDAARASYEFKDQHTTVEAIGILQNAKDDAWLQTINDQDRFVTEQNEKGAILSVANTTFTAANIAGYFIYKHDNRVNGFNPGNPAPRAGDNADIYTIGGRATGRTGDHLKYSAEGAWQFGRKEDVAIQFPSTSTEFRDINAFGVNSKLTWLFKDTANDQLNFSYEYLSGDDPKTGTDEMFDVLWGRWTRWSEVGLYSFANETRIGQEANMHRIGPGWNCTPLKGMDITANYLVLLADQDVPTRAANPALFTGNGNFRGHFLQGILRYKFNDHLSGNLWSEFLFPGDFYAHKAPMSYLRGELMLAF